MDLLKIVYALLHVNQLTSQMHSCKSKHATEDVNLAVAIDLL